MPNNTKSKKKAPKKGNNKTVAKRKFVKKRNPVLTIGKIIGGFGDRYFCELDVYDATFMVTAAAVFTRYSMRCSDILNAINGAADAPAGWNELALIYNKFIVHAASIQVDIVNLSSTLPICMSIFPSNIDESTANLDNYEEWYEYPYCKSKILTPLSGSKSNVKMSLSMKSAKVMGTTKIKSVNEDYVGFTGSTNSIQTYAVAPEPWRYILGFNTLDGTTNIGTNTLAAKIRMKFKVEFFERLKGY